MELWIRSQDGQKLIKANELIIEQFDDHKPFTFKYYIKNKDVCLGTYKSGKRALEVLDEINNMLKNKYIVQANCPIGKEELKLQHDKLINDYSGEFIMQPPEYKIEQVNNCIYYEMPKE